MEGILVKLKAILNGLSDEELKKYDLWIDNKKGGKVIAIDENAITIITDDKMLKINNMRW